ncbi:MAG TPA: hypothetical protein VFM01_15555 [Nakamurella sp.]|nr:hypothetical protein [Nakamurella sp.]
MTGAVGPVTGPLRVSGGWRAAPVLLTIVAAGVAGSLLVGVAGWWLWSHRLVWNWTGVAADAAAFAVVAVWCRRLAGRGSCDAERRLYLAPAIGLVALTVTCLVQLAIDGGWTSYGTLLFYKMFTGQLIWSIVFVALVLWRLCRSYGHVHTTWPAGRGEEGNAAP